ncbi:MAG TPA: hypothetical protein VN649_13125 [Ramlibacter sp.]|nr:hypothetical protein [Ramlibacter sp.]
MTRSMKSRIAAAMLAIGSLGTVAVANAYTAYDAPYSYSHGWRYQREHDWRSGCRAPAWDPNARYMPGQRVWRNGYLFVATRLSASVWNVNSPPEWTPNYWAPAGCR